MKYNVKLEAPVCVVVKDLKLTKDRIIKSGTVVDALIRMDDALLFDHAGWWSIDKSLLKKKEG